MDGELQQEEVVRIASTEGPKDDVSLGMGDIERSRRDEEAAVLRNPPFVY